MNHSLARFQDDFIQALYGHGDAPVTPLAPALAPLSAHFSATAQSADVSPMRFDKLSSQPGFKVYRNNVIKACIDALQANFPSVERLVGNAWFRSAAAVYVAASPPTTVSLLEYGASFAEFLAHFAPAGELPYLSAVARLDRLWIESHSAADDTPITPAALALLPAEVLGETVLQPHAAARWAWFSEHPAYTIWCRNRPSAEADAETDTSAELAWVAEGALLTRTHGKVSWQSASLGTCAFLDACAAGRPLAQAAQCALDAQPSQDVAQLLSELLGAGALRAVTTQPH